jgi:tetratricopeptide (TPR) repeat protein
MGKESWNAFMTRYEGLLLGVAIGVVSFLVFMLHAAPSVTFHDSGEFALAAASGGVPHPPGAPTWTSLATLFVRAGGFMGNPARGTNLFSSLWAAVSLGLIGGLAFRCLEVMYCDLHLAIRRGIALLPVLVMLSSRAFLEQGFITEQYTLLTALALLGIVLVTLVATPRKRIYELNLVFLLGLVVGLAIGNHPSQLILCILIVAALWLLSSREEGVRWDRRIRRVAWPGIASMMGLGAGLCIYLWVPVRSRMQPMLDWGNVESLDRMFWALSREQWARRALNEAPPGFVGDWMASYDFFGQLGVVGCVAAIAGLVVAWKRSRFVFVVLASVGVTYAVGMLYGHLTQANIDALYIKYYGISDWHILLYVICSLFTVFAFGESLVRLPGWKGGLALALIAMVLGGSAVKSIASSSMRHFDAPARYYHAVTSPLPDDALVLLRRDDLLFPVAYGNRFLSLGSRRHVALESIPFSEFMLQGGGGDGPSNMEGRERYVQAAILDPELQPFRFSGIHSRLLAELPLIVEYPEESKEIAEWILPCGFLARVMNRKTSDEDVIASENQWLRQCPDAKLLPDGTEHASYCSAMASLAIQKGSFFMLRKMWPLAASYYEMVVSWMPDRVDAWYVLGDIRGEMKDWPGAQEAYLAALEIDPLVEGVRNRLAIIFARHGQEDKAKLLWEEELRIHPENEAAKANLEQLSSRRKET